MLKTVKDYENCFKEVNAVMVKYGCSMGDIQYPCDYLRHIPSTIKVGLSDNEYFMCGKKFYPNIKSAPRKERDRYYQDLEYMHKSIWEYSQFVEWRLLRELKLIEDTKVES